MQGLVLGKLLAHLGYEVDTDCGEGSAGGSVLDEAGSVVEEGG